MELSEEEFLRLLGERLPEVGDDAAVLAGGWLASCDAVVEGVHLPAGCSLRQMAARALCTALSDIAAMGGVPRWALVSLFVPRLGHRLLEEFLGGLTEVAERCGVRVVGGNTCRFPRAVVDLFVVGQMEAGLPPVRRSGARPGDLLFLTGSLGDAALGRRLLMSGQRLPPESGPLLERYLRPWPRLEEGRRLASIAHAMIDVSDGLLVDAGRLARASGVRLRLYWERLPLSRAFRELGGEPELALSGDDYELLYAVDPRHRREAARLGTWVGEVLEGDGVELVGWRGPETVGFDHFVTPWTQVS